MTYKCSFPIGNNLISVRFIDIDQFGRFNTAMMAIKYMAADIDKDVKKKKMSPQQIDAVYRNWLVHCSKFQEDWGDQMVFPDIRWAWNDVELALGIKTTKFKNISGKTESGFEFLSITSL